MEVALHAVKELESLSQGLGRTVGMGNTDSEKRFEPCPRFLSSPVDFGKGLSHPKVSPASHPPSSSLLAKESLAHLPWQQWFDLPRKTRTEDRVRSVGGQQPRRSRLSSRLPPICVNLRQSAGKFRKSFRPAFTPSLESSSLKSSAHSPPQARAKPPISRMSPMSFFIRVIREIRGQTRYLTPTGCHPPPPPANPPILRSHRGKHFFRNYALTIISPYASLTPMAHSIHHRTGEEMI